MGYRLFLPIHICEFNVQKNLDASDLVVNITQHSLSNISCMSNKQGYDDNDENLTVNNSGNNPYDNENKIQTCSKIKYRREGEN